MSAYYNITEQQRIKVIISLEQSLTRNYVNSPTKQIKLLLELVRELKRIWSQVFWNIKNRTNPQIFWNINFVALFPYIFKMWKGPNFLCFVFCKYSLEIEILLSESWQDHPLGTLWCSTFCLWVVVILEIWVATFYVIQLSFSPQYLLLG